MPISRFSFYGIPNILIGNRGFKALSVLQAALAVGDIVDARSTSPKKLNVRRSLVVPKGTLFGWDEKLIKSLIKEGYLEKREPDSKVLDLTINGEDHEFIFSELAAELSKLDVSEKSELLSDPMKCRAELVARLFMARFPYEDE